MAMKTKPYTPDGAGLVFVMVESITDGPRPLAQHPDPDAGDAAA